MSLYAMTETSAKAHPKKSIPVSFLRCPASGLPLAERDGALISANGHNRYRISAEGIPLFAEQEISEEGRIQQAHYDGMAVQYLKNLEFPHTKVYIAYLDNALHEAAAQAQFDSVAEICCGRGDALRLYGDRIGRGIGVDVSLNMLTAAASEVSDDGVKFVQGDATNLPLADHTFDTVIMLGGIHHVNDRVALFSEIARILKPGGKFLWREPLDDFLPWRAIRKVIYWISPDLDEKTESPLRYAETRKTLEEAGLNLSRWETYGFLGFCFFMNSDVLVFNRLFRFVPAIEVITRAAVRLDDWTRQLPGFRDWGLQVVGMASKPAK